MTLTATGLAGSTLRRMKFLESRPVEGLVGVWSGGDHQNRIGLARSDIKESALVHHPQRGEGHRPAGARSMMVAAGAVAGAAKVSARVARIESSPTGSCAGSAANRVTSLPGGLGPLGAKTRLRQGVELVG